MKTHYTKQQGFTLIELMIVVAIIGVLAAIAVPQYQNYVAKSEASSALATISGIRTNVETYVLGEGKFPSNEDEIRKEVGIPTSNLGTITLQPKENGDGSIEFKFTTGSPLVNGKTLTLARTAEGSWECTTEIAKSVIPKACEQQKG
ncbi:pilin [Vibrio metschnikovii]|uniref:pilin n=1 Tax=Vibrio metschnikovii TaxID=28172 RepID=UPI00165E2D06|nr:pilin [Vibrio metschnikovii]EKO3659009.1 pilin [Vibrio metschnikovii]